MATTSTRKPRTAKQSQEPKTSNSKKQKTSASATENKPPRRGRGRVRNPNYLEWEELREYIRSEMIPSRNKFEEWWMQNKPKTIPRFPYRVFKNEWISWNDFLGTNNEWRKVEPKKYRSLTDAMSYVHKLELKTMAEWLEWARIPDNIPQDIPRRPDLVYKDWRGWGYWLGTTVLPDLEKIREFNNKRHVFYVIHEQNTPDNVVSIGIETGGLPVLRERWNREHFDIIKLFWYDDNRASQIEEIINALTIPYKSGTENQRLLTNAWEFLYYIQMKLEAVTRLQMSQVNPVSD